jgi:hypothetical protein
MVAKLPSYEIVTPPIGIIYYDAGPTVSELHGNNLMAQHWQIIGMVGKRLPLALQQ